MTGTNEPERPGCEVRGFCLEQTPSTVEVLWAILDATERRRAESFVFAADRDRWVVARASLRLILAERLEKDPTSLVLANTPLGKPVLLNETDDLHFNLSHGGSWGAVILSEVGPAGIDLEPFSAGAQLGECLEDFCHPDEWARLALLPAAAKARELIKTWCAKEACLKAAGLGLRIAPNKLKIQWVNSDHATIELKDGLIPRCNVHLHDVPWMAGYCLASAGANDLGRPQVHPFDPQVFNVAWSSAAK